MACWENVFVGAAVVSLGRAHDLSRAVAAGHYDAWEREQDAYRCVRVAAGGGVPEMTMRAARTAQRRSGPPDGGFDLVVHASSWLGDRQEATAGRVSRELASPRATALEVRQSSNGGVVALHLAAEYLSGPEETPETALVTTSDCAPAPHADRYREQPGRVLADGATGLVLRKGTGVARVLSTVVAGDPPPGALFRSDLPWKVLPDRHRVPGLLGRGRRSSRGRGRALDELAALLAGREREVVRSALAQAGRGIDQVARFVFPHLGRRLQAWNERAELGIKEHRTTWEWGRGVGCLPSGDQIAGLAHLLDEGHLFPGDTVVLVGGGCGSSFGCAVLEKL